VRAAVLTLVIVIAACGTSPTNGDAGIDAGIDAGPDAFACPHKLDQLATPAGDGGFCCLADAGCSGGSTGGWAASAADCCSRYDGIQDVAFKTSTDSHGCIVRTEVTDNSICCMCPFEAGAKDTSSDVTNDSASDATSD
jgi:hypothetical protein